MIAAIYARKSTQQRRTDVEQKSVPGQIAHAKDLNAQTGVPVPGR